MGTAAIMKNPVLTIHEISLSMSREQVIGHLGQPIRNFSNGAYETFSFTIPMDERIPNAVSQDSLVVVVSCEDFLVHSIHGASLEMDGKEAVFVGDSFGSVRSALMTKGIAMLNPIRLEYPELKLIVSFLLDGKVLKPELDVFPGIDRLTVGHILLAKESPLHRSTTAFPA